MGGSPERAQFEWETVDVRAFSKLNTSRLLDAIPCRVFTERVVAVLHIWTQVKVRLPGSGGSKEANSQGRIRIGAKQCLSARLARVQRHDFRLKWLASCLFDDADSSCKTGVAIRAVWLWSSLCLLPMLSSPLHFCSPRGHWFASFRSGRVDFVDARSFAWHLTQVVNEERRSPWRTFLRSHWTENDAATRDSVIRNESAYFEQTAPLRLSTKLAVGEWYLQWVGRFCFTNRAGERYTKSASEATPSVQWRSYSLIRGRIAVTEPCRRNWTKTPDSLMLSPQKKHLYTKLGWKFHVELVRSFVDPASPHRW